MRKYGLLVLSLLLLIDLLLSQNRVLWLLNNLLVIILGGLILWLLLLLLILPCFNIHLSISAGDEAGGWAKNACAFVCRNRGRKNMHDLLKGLVGALHLLPPKLRETDWCKSLVTPV